MNFGEEDKGRGEWAGEARRDGTRLVYCGSKKGLKGSKGGLKTLLMGVVIVSSTRCSCLVELTCLFRYKQH